MSSNLMCSLTTKANQSIVSSITDESYIGMARRKSIVLADSLGFSKTEMDRIAIIINELGSNLIKHANKLKERQLVFQVVWVKGKKTFQIIALDGGPGILNFTQCLQDGYSTTHTAGNGLGAIMRLADFFNVYSLLNSGTIALAQVQMKAKNENHLPSFMNISGICLPKIGEDLSGDGWASYQSHRRCLVMVADGLGHGQGASEASELACEIFQKNKHLSPAQIMYLINVGLRKTRGAAVAIMEIDKIQKQVKFAGLGNISGYICIEKRTHHLVSHDGTAGVGQHKIQEYSYPWDATALFCMHSDGLISRWSLSDYPGLSSRDPAIIAGALYRDFSRGNDDVTVLVGRQYNDNLN